MIFDRVPRWMNQQSMRGEREKSFGSEGGLHGGGGRGA